MTPIVATCFIYKEKKNIKNQYINNQNACFCLRFTQTNSAELYIFFKNDIFMQKKKEKKKPKIKQE